MYLLVYLVYIVLLINLSVCSCTRLVSFVPSRELERERQSSTKALFVDLGLKYVWEHPLLFYHFRLVCQGCY